MENTSYGISPEEELSTVMKDIEKNIQEQEINGVEDDNSNEENLAALGSDEKPNEEIEKIDDKEDLVNEADLFREKYHSEKKRRKIILADREKLEYENQQLKNALDGTIDDNTKLYGRDLYNDLEKIKNIKKQALLGDDPDLLIEADEIYQKTLYKINEFENILSNRPPLTNNNESVYEENYNQQIQLSKAQEWLSEHPELIEGSYNYNPKVQKELSLFIEQFDRELKQNGRADEILSDAYLDVLDEFVDSVKINRSKNGYTTSNVGGVRNNFSNGSSGPIKVTLTEFDKNYAKNLGISDKEYLKYKIEDMKESRNKR